MIKALHVCQEGEITTEENRDTEILTSDPNLENTSNWNAIINVYSDEQPSNISRKQSQVCLWLMQSIRVEWAMQTEALHKESKKLIALLKAVC
jgi:hypothetical protein